jgi:hypothetical protein
MAQKALSFPAHSHEQTKKLRFHLHSFLEPRNVLAQAEYTHSLFNSLSLLLALGKCTATLWEKKSWRGIKQSHSLAHYLCRTKSAAATHKTQTLTEPVEIIMKTERNRHTRMGREKSEPAQSSDRLPGGLRGIKKKREKEAMDRILLFSLLPGALAKRYAGKADVLTGHEIKTGNNFHRT